MSKYQTNFTGEESEPSASKLAREAAVEEVPHGTVREVLDWVGTEKARAKKALAVEKKNDSRVSVLDALAKVLAAEEV